MGAGKGRAGRGRLLSSGRAPTPQLSRTSRVNKQTVQFLMNTVVENIDRIRRESSVKGGCNVLNLPTIGLGYWVSLRISHIFKLCLFISMVPRATICLISIFLDLQNIYGSENSRNLPINIGFSFIC